MNDRAGPLLRDYKLALVKVGKQVTPCQDLHNNLYVVCIFKNIIKPNYVWMLNDLDHFDLTF